MHTQFLNHHIQCVHVSAQEGHAATQPSPQPWRDLLHLSPAQAGPTPSLPRPPLDTHLTPRSPDGLGPSRSTPGALQLGMGATGASCLHSKDLTEPSVMLTQPGFQRGACGLLAAHCQSIPAASTTSFLCTGAPSIPLPFT